MTISNPNELRRATLDLSMSMWTLASVGALLDAGLLEQLREPRTVDQLSSPTLSRERIGHVLDVVATAGVVVRDGATYRLAEGLLPLAQMPPMRASITADVRTSLLQAVAFLDEAAGRRPPTAGWRHSDPAVLQSQGDASIGVAMMYKMHLVPQLGDLGARLDKPGARFLDIGVGVGSLAIAMARAWPNIKITGLDVMDAPLAIARDTIKKAQLEDRIDLRVQPCEQLDEEGVYDLIWLPSFFITPTSQTIERAARALKPGGWLTVCMMGGETDRQKAVSALITDLWGGPSMTDADAVAAMTKAGLTAKAICGPAWGPQLAVGTR